MRTETYRCPANTTIKQARLDLRKALRAEGINGKIVSIDLDPAKQQFVASVKISEFPPAPKEDAPAPDPMGDAPLDEAAPEDLDLGMDDEAPEPDMGEVLDLLHQIADALGVKGKDEELPEELNGGGLDAPAEDEMLPPPAADPADSKPGVFSSLAPKVASKRSFVVERTNALKVSNEAIIAEVSAGFPDAKVTRIQRSEDKSIVRIAMVRK